MTCIQESYFEYLLLHLIKTLTIHSGNK